MLRAPKLYFDLPLVDQRPHRDILGFLRHKRSEFTIKCFFDLYAKKPIIMLNKYVFLKLVGWARKKFKKLVRHCCTTVPES